MERLENKIGFNEQTGVSVRYHIVGKSERNEIDYTTSMHVSGAQNSKYIGVTTDGVDA
jgi:hypothetical protein